MEKGRPESVNGRARSVRPRDEAIEIDLSRPSLPALVISCAVCWHFRFQLSLRGIEELLFERGVLVSYETVRRWCEWNEQPPTTGSGVPTN